MITLVNVSDFTKFGVCIDIVEILVGIVDGQILSLFDKLSARDMSLFSLQDDNFSKYQWIFTRLDICIALILWRSALRLLKGETSILTESSARNISIFYSYDNNLNKSQWIFTNFDVCIDIVKICLGIPHGQISSFFF